MNTKALLKTIDEWKLAATEQVDDIGGWRDSPEERIFHGGWPEPPNLFFSSSVLVSEVCQRFPKLDPTPIQDIYGAISAWHEDHNARRIPAQPVLVSTLERAVMVVTAITDDLLAGQTEVAVNNDGERGAAEQREKKPSVNARMMDLISKQPECHTWSAQQFANVLGCSKSTISETKAWASLKVYREMARQDRAAEKQTAWQRKGQKTGR